MHVTCSPDSMLTDSEAVMTACIAPTDFNWFNSVIEFVSCAIEPVLERPHLTNLFKFPETNSLSIQGLAFMRLATYESASWRNPAGAGTNHGFLVRRLCWLACRTISVGTELHDSKRLRDA